MPDSDNLQERYSARLDDEPDTETDEKAATESDDRNARKPKNSSPDRNATRDTNAWNVENVKKEWIGMTFYLPPALRQRVDDEYDWARYVADRSIKKDRHYKPLLIELGLERMERMEGEELEERIEQLGEED